MNTTTVHEGQIEERGAARERPRTSLATRLGKLISILVGLCLVIAVVGAAGLGVWAYSLNAQLAQAHADYLALKNSNEKLNSNFNALTAQSAKASADLTAAQAQISSLEDQLKKAQTQNDTFKSQIPAIQARVSILYLWSFGLDESTFEKKLYALGDPELKTLWDDYKKTHSNQDAWNIQESLVQSIADLLANLSNSTQG